MFCLSSRTLSSANPWQTVEDLLVRTAVVLMSRDLIPKKRINIVVTLT